MVVRAVRRLIRPPFSLFNTFRHGRLFFMFIFNIHLKTTIRAKRKGKGEERRGGLSPSIQKTCWDQTMCGIDSPLKEEARGLLEI